MINILIGVIVWQIITTIAIIIAESIGEYDKKTLTFSGGLPLLLIIGLVTVATSLVRLYRVSNLRTILIDESGNFYNCKPKNLDKVLNENRELNIAKWNTSFADKYPRESYSKRHQRFYGSMRYAPKKIWKSFIEIVPKDF